MNKIDQAKLSYIYKNKFSDTSVTCWAFETNCKSSSVTVDRGVMVVIILWLNLQLPV